MYFSTTDSAGHRYGPNSQELKEAVKSIDNTLGKLYEGIKKSPLSNNIQLIVVSDHGMTQLSREKIIYYDDYINGDDIRFNGNYSPVGMFDVKDPSKKEVIYNKLKNANPHMRVYYKEEVPKELHFSNNTNIPEIITIADNGWSMNFHDYVDDHEHAFTGGTHGYDPKNKDMHGIFIANGSLFKNESISNFNTIDLYELMCTILKLKPAKNDGSEKNAIQVLKKK